MFLLLLLDADCSGRSLATLLVAWVMTVMVASIFLRWDYMWIVLAVLTLLFLLVCGYTTYNAKKAHARSLIEEPRRITDIRVRREGEIRTISGIIIPDNSREQRDSSASYATHLIADLPPSYDSAISVQPATLSSRTSLTVDQSDELKFEEPPPYSIVISSINLRNPTTEEISHAPKPNTLLSAGKETTISSRDS